MKFKPCRSIFVVIFTALVMSFTLQAKTLSNKDIEKLKTNPQGTLTNKNLQSVYSTSGALSNKDINLLKQKVNHGIPPYKSSHPDIPTYNPNRGQLPGVPGEYSPSHPDIPSIPSAPVVPGVPGAYSSPTIPQGRGAMIVKKHLPYEEWESEYKDYFRLHYHDDELSLTPGLIALHYSKTQDFSKLWWTFVNGGKYEGKPGHLSVHYVVDRDGTIYELIPPNRRARGTYGVNHKAISIDLIGMNENDILRNDKQMKTGFALVKWLMERYNIPKEKVLAHDEIALGRELVEEYEDFYDKDFPDRYPPGSNTRGPGKAYMFKLRYYLVEPR